MPHTVHLTYIKRNHNQTMLINIISPLTHARLIEPCDGCAAPYGYKHHMKLSTDTSAFSVS